MRIRSIAISGLLLGILFKTLHWPGANLLLQVSSLLVIGTLLLLLIQKRGTWTVELPRPAMLVGSVIAVIIGGLFKMMHWPGANIMLLLGLAACAAWFLIPQRKSPATPQ